MKTDDLRKSGKLVFRWGWWFPRQLSMREFRLGALEYEMSEDANGKKIFLHIPSDADLSERSVSHSIGAAKSFFEKYYPDFAGADMYCDSWMLAPALREVLPESSNIMNFRRRFKVIRVNEDSKAFLEWIYPDPSVSYTVREKYEPRLWRNLFGIFLLIFLAIRLYSGVIFTKI